MTGKQSSTSLSKQVNKGNSLQPYNDGLPIVHCLAVKVPDPNPLESLGVGSHLTVQLQRLPREGEQNRYRRRGEPF